jgi:hypothetical protein
MIRRVMLFGALPFAPAPLVEESCAPFYNDLANLWRKIREPLEKMAESPDAVVAEHARWGLERLG